MHTSIQICDWSPGRLCVTGKHPDHVALADELRKAAPMKHEFARPAIGGFTFSFPSDRRREVERAIVRLERTVESFNP